jgi:hypothetical protein
MTECVIMRLDKESIVRALRDEPKFTSSVARNPHRRVGVCHPSIGPPP